MERRDVLVPLRLLGVGLLICGLLYQGSLAVIGTAVFPNNAAGSPVTVDGQVVGSAEIGQDFRPNDPGDAQYFWSRPSSINYDAMQSASENLGPTNPALAERVRGDLRNISQYETPDSTVPVNLVAESGSAYDAEISPAAAQYQVPRVANQTGISAEQLRGMIQQATAEPWLGVWGHEAVNVLELNLMVREELQQNQQNASSQRIGTEHNQFERGDH